MNLLSRWRSVKLEWALGRQIDLLQRQLDRLPSNVPERSELLNDLGNRWRNRYLRTGERDEIDRAVDCYRQAISGPGVSGTVRHLVAGNLAAALVDRYHASGNLADLEAGVRAARDAASDPAAGPHDRAQHLANLANALNELHERTRRRSDLDEAIASSEEALELASGGARVAAVASLNLAVTLLARAAAGDVTRAVDLLRSAATNLPEGSPEQQQARLNWAIANTLPGNPAEMAFDADKATIAELAELARQAPPTSPRRSAALNAIGRGRWGQYQRSGALVRLDAAIAALQAAVDALPPDAGDLPRYLNDLGIALTELSFTSDKRPGVSQGAGCVGPRPHPPGGAVRRGGA